MSARTDYPQPVGRGSQQASNRQWAAMCDEIDRLRNDVAYREAALHKLTELAERPRSDQRE